MGLRNNKVLKLLSIILFTFGLVAPVVASDLQVQAASQTGHQAVTPVSVHHNGLSQLLFEENSSEEEREAKADKHVSIILFSLLPDTSLLNTLGAHKTDGYNSCPIQKMGTHPELYRLFRSFLM